MVKQNPALQQGEIAHAYKALEGILGESGGRVPARNQLAILQSVFGPKFVETLLNARPAFAKAADLGVELVNAQRSLVTTYDASIPFRQGIFFIGRPKQFVPAFAQMFRFMFSPKIFEESSKEIASRPTFPLMQQGGVAFTSIGGLLEKREEDFIGSNLAEKIPIIGAGVRASNRAAVGFLNKIRADVFDDIAKHWGRVGGDIADPVFTKELADLVNRGTGRGTLPKKWDRALPFFSTFLFSPRLQAARVQMLNPVYYSKAVFAKDPAVRFVRKEALKSAMSYAAIAGSALALLKYAGADVEPDPRSADWGKIRIGDTRYDLFGGFQQYLRLGAQLIPNFGTQLPVGAVKSTRTGQVREYDKGFHAPNRLAQLTDFMENKLAPVPELIVNAFRGHLRIPDQPLIPEIQAIVENRSQPAINKRQQRKLDATNELVKLIAPLALRDAIDSIAEWGKETGTVMATPAMLGIGMQVYPSPHAHPSPMPNSLLARVLAKRQGIKLDSKIITKASRIAGTDSLGTAPDSSDTSFYNQPALEPASATGDTLPLPEEGYLYR